MCVCSIEGQLLTNERDLNAFTTLTLCLRVTHYGLVECLNHLDTLLYIQYRDVSSLYFRKSKTKNSYRFNIEEMFPIYL